MKFLRHVIPGLKENFEVKLLVPDFGPSEDIDVEVDKVQLSSVVKAAGYPSAEISYKTMQAVKREVLQADVIFVQDLAVLGALAIHYGKKYGKKVVVYVHQLAWDQLAAVKTKSLRLKRIISAVGIRAAKSLYKKCNVVLLPSRGVAQSLERQGIRGRRAIVRLGVDTDMFAPAKNKQASKLKIKISKDKIVIGYCGRISKEKDLGTLLEAFETLKKKHSNLYLLLVGDGEDDEKKRFNGLKDVKITGFKENVIQYYQAMDIFVLSSLTETTSLATMEALSCGIPVIVTPVGRVKEYVHSGYNGFFFPKNSAAALSEKLNYLIRNPEQRIAMGERARKSMIGRSWKRTVAKLIRIFNDLEV